MKKKALKLGAMALAAGLALPLAADAAEADLQVRIDKLTQQMEELKGQVKQVEDKSLGKWLQIGGSYQFRIDSLHGKTKGYTDAMGTMQAMVGDFLVGPNAAAISGPTGGFAGYAMQSQPGALFSPGQFGLIMNSYMPSAMYGGFTSTDFLTQLNSIIGGGPTAISGAISGTALTAQQSKILNTLTRYGVMDKVFAMPASANIKMGGAQVPGTTLGAQWNNMMTSLAGNGLNPQQITQLANQMLLQGFLGAGSPYQAAGYTPSFKPKNETLYTNKFALDLKAKATQNVTVNVKLDMYKAFGSQDQDTTSNGYFSDRVGVFDGVLGHVPSNSYLNVDRAYATWSNIMDQPVWISVGRRPSTDGAPSNLKSNTAKPGNGGTPALLVNYAFDGMTLGYAPDIEMLPGFYAKVCYGRGFDSGFKGETPGNSVKDTDMLGVAVIPYETDTLRIWTQWNRGFNIFDFPKMNNTVFGNTSPSDNLGAIDWFGGGAMTTIKELGPGDLNAFTDFGLSISRPNHSVSQNAGFQGLMSGEFFAQDFNPKSQEGYAFFAGVRYDLPSRTKLGFEYNYGSKYWITFAPASDDMWTSKVGTRGQVFEPYIIQELNLKPISSFFAKTFFKIGYQYYDFNYTGSNNWVGKPKKISSIKSTDLMMMAPVKEAHDIYGTFEVHF